MIEAGNWQDNLLDIANAGADTMAQFLHYYGVDGLGYNSEFSNGYAVQQKLIPYHVALVKKMKGDYMETGTYIYNDDVQCNKNVIKPGETFEMSFVDPMHESATWTLYDVMGNKVFEQTGHTITVEGLPNLGSYDLVVKGAEYNAAGTSR